MWLAIHCHVGFIRFADLLMHLTSIKCLFWKQYGRWRDYIWWKKPYRKTYMHMMHCSCLHLFADIWTYASMVFFLVVNPDPLCWSTRSGNSDPTLQKALQVLMLRGNFVRYLRNVKLRLFRVEPAGVYHVEPVEHVMYQTWGCSVSSSDTLDIVTGICRISIWLLR